MDRVTLSRIDEELESSEVAALCFLCHDVVNRKRLEGVNDAKALFLRLEERGLLDNHTFLSQLLHTIRRADLLSLLETDSRQPLETDANPMLSEYRVMLYRVYEDMTQENLDKMKFLLSSKLGRRQIEACNTALDVFAEMEKACLLSKDKLDELNAVLLEFDQQLALIVRLHMQRPIPLAHVSMDNQRDIRISQQRPQPVLAETEMQPSDAGPTVYTDAEPNTGSLSDQTEYYALMHNPRGQCVVFNNEKFLNMFLKDRGGTEQDEKVLRKVFTQLGFTVVVHNNLTAGDIRREIKQLGRRNFLNDDVLVVCVLSHGEKGCVFGTDEKPVDLGELTQPFTSGRAPTLAGKPKLFFIQACQGNNYQTGSVPCPPRPSQEREHRESQLEEDAGPVRGETIPSDADFLLGMATVQECKSFRNTSTGSIYIQQLCNQLMKSAKSPENDDILTVLTRVNREVSKGEYSSHKQMPEPKYTLTKKLVFKCV
uniref:Caspase-8 n=1 Tax=Totoaba macdonaldi TaxID=245095 RepID=A0A1W6JGV2_9TELE|nr:caspase 8 [Totoaba macdonaldi]